MTRGEEQLYGSLCGEYLRLVLSLPYQLDGRGTLGFEGLSMFELMLGVV